MSVMGREGAGVNERLVDRARDDLACDVVPDREVGAAEDDLQVGQPTAL
jgi:hypothetical protein